MPRKTKKVEVREDDHEAAADVVAQLLTNYKPKRKRRKERAKGPEMAVRRKRKTHQAISYGSLLVVCNYVVAPETIVDNNPTCKRCRRASRRGRN